jgi:hypothetical protein
MVRNGEARGSLAFSSTAFVAKWALTQGVVVACSDKRVGGLKGGARVRLLFLVGPLTWNGLDGR